MEIQQHAYVLIFQAVIFSTPAMSTAINYTCESNGSIIASNPDPAVYTGVFANDTNGPCKTNLNDKKTYAIINGCYWDSDIFLMFSIRSRIGEDYVLGGVENMIFVLRCNDVPADGLVKIVRQGLDVYAKPTKMPTQTPLIDVRTNMYTSKTFDTVATRAEIGTKLYWRIYCGARFYDLLPLNCTAYSGTEQKGKSLTFVANGCSMDKDLTSDFNLTKRWDIWANFYAFRFFESPYLTIFCTVKLCQLGSSMCDSLCYCLNSQIGSFYAGMGSGFAISSYPAYFSTLVHIAVPDSGYLDCSSGRQKKHVNDETDDIIQTKVSTYIWIDGAMMIASSGSGHNLIRLSVCILLVILRFLL